MKKIKGNTYNWILPKIGVLKNLYYGKSLSTNQIAKKYDATSTAVSRKLKRAGIKLRTMSEQREITAGNKIILTKEGIDFLNGLLLGDGCLCSHSRYGKSVTYSHTDKHKNYLNWLFIQLKKLGLKKGPIRKNYNDTFQQKTKNYRGDLFELRQKWYPDGKKRVPESLYLSPNCLKNWYIGDGSFRAGIHGTKKAERVILCMLYDKEGRIFLANQLQKIGIKNSICFEGIYIKACGRKLFFNYMLSENSFVPRCYLYKFPNHYCEVKKCH